jgi:vacuolar-type H+-ATPase subunit H
MSTESSSTPKPSRKPATKSMIGEGTGATTPSDAGGSAGNRAQEMRGTLKVRQEAEALFAEATQLRQRAVADADAMVAEAESLAGELVYEARNEAQRLVAEAQERAEGIVAVARTEAEEMREETEREREQLREAVADAVRADVERAHGGLTAVTPALEEAIGAVSGALAALEVLRGDDWTPRRTAALEPVGPQTVADPSEEPDEEDVTRITSLADAAGTEPDAGGEGEDGDARPLGWLFRSTQA